MSDDVPRVPESDEDSQGRPYDEDDEDDLVDEDDEGSSRRLVLDDLDEEYDRSDLFGFAREEWCIVDSLITSTRRMLGRSDVEPKDVRHLAALLLGLLRLPLPTEGLHVHVSLEYHYGGSMTGMSLELETGALRLSDVTWEDYGAGGESWSGVMYEVETGGYQYAPYPYGVPAWLEAFQDRASDRSYHVVVDSHSDAELDWDAVPCGDEAWELLERE